MPKTKKQLEKENDLLKLALQTIYSQCGDGPLTQRWIGWVGVKHLLDLNIKKD